MTRARRGGSRARARVESIASVVCDAVVYSFVYVIDIISVHFPP